MKCYACKNTEKRNFEIPQQFEHEDLSKLGWIQFYDRGDENLYFAYKNELGHIHKGFIKF